MPTALPWPWPTPAHALANAQRAHLNRPTCPHAQRPSQGLQLKPRVYEEVLVDFQIVEAGDISGEVDDAWLNGTGIGHAKRTKLRCQSGECCKIVCGGRCKSMDPCCCPPLPLKPPHIRRLIFFSRVSPTAESSAWETTSPTFVKLQRQHAKLSCTPALFNFDSVHLFGQQTRQHKRRPLTRASRLRPNTAVTEDLLH